MLQRVYSRWLASHFILLTQVKGLGVGPDKFLYVRIYIGRQYPLLPFFCHRKKSPKPKKRNQALESIPWPPDLISAHTLSSSFTPGMKRNFLKGAGTTFPHGTDADTNRERESDRDKNVRHWPALTYYDHQRSLRNKNALLSREWVAARGSATSVMGLWEQMCDSRSRRQTAWEVNRYSCTSGKVKTTKYTTKLYP